uniref:Uncharacterized protein n=1 Tax=Anguilla anguilla TaxID=7936 RepID=A0A0E9WBJ6_ANGAN
MHRQRCDMTLVSFNGFQALPLLGTPDTQKPILSSTQQVRSAIELQT